MDKIKISLLEVSNSADSIAKCNQQMYEKLQQIKHEINALKNTWISDGADALRERFNSFSNQFEQKKEIIDTYVQFLKLSVSSYDSLESNIQSNASSFTH